jgi:hypothetical protein
MGRDILSSPSDNIMSPISKEIRQKKDSQKGYISVDLLHVHNLLLQTPKIKRCKFKVSFFLVSPRCLTKEFQKIESEKENTSLNEPNLK